jgi:hypothetical protein
MTIAIPDMAFSLNNMILPYNIGDIFKFPHDVQQDIRQNYAIHREYAASNGNYRNAVLTAPLERSLANLNRIETLIESRMSKDTASGTDMTAAGLLLDTAKGNLSDATNAVAEATSTTSGTSLRPSFVKAYITLNDAKDALDTVVDAIAAAEDSSTKNTTN